MAGIITGHDYFKVKHPASDEIVRQPFPFCLLFKYIHTKQFSV